MVPFSSHKFPQKKKKNSIENKRSKYTFTVEQSTEVLSIENIFLTSKLHNLYTYISTYRYKSVLIYIVNVYNTRLFILFVIYYCIISAKYYSMKMEKHCIHRK